MFLSIPNEDVPHLFLDKKFEPWNTAFKSWFMENDYVAAKRPNTTTIQQYISEICRYSEYIHERMKAKNINWNLNDLLLFNKTNGSSFNTQNGITFFEDPTDYMIDEDLPLSRKLKLLMGLVHATEFIASTVIAGKNPFALPA